MERQIRLDHGSIKLFIDKGNVMKNSYLRQTGVALALSLICSGSLAANVSTPLSVTTPFGAQWDVSNQNYSGDPSGAVFNISDASFGGASDAYDSGWLVSVNGTYFSATTVDLEGTSVSAPSSSMSGLNVSVKYYFAPNSAVARILVTLQNPTAAPIAASVGTATNFGSDSGTTLQMTSSGDNSLTTGDRWLVTSDGGPSDPVNTSVLYGPGVVAEVPTAYSSAVHNGAGNQGIAATFDLSVPAGQTQTLLFFAGLGNITSVGNTVAGAIAAAGNFNNNNTIAGEWLQGLSQSEIDQVVNWNPAGLVGTPTTTCASEGYTGTKLTWCKNICENGLTGAVLDTWIHRWILRYRDLPYCAVEYK